MYPRWMIFLRGGLEGKGRGLVLAVVRDLRERRAPVSLDELEAFEVDVLAGFVLARASAGLADATIRSEWTGRLSRTGGVGIGSQPIPPCRRPPLCARVYVQKDCVDW
jgi:hypothetical protein